jgi:hypothetical protein
VKFGYRDILLDSSSQQKAKDIYGRLIKKLNFSAGNVLAAEGLTAERLDYFLPTFETILSKYGLLPNECVQANLDAHRATQTVIERAEPILRSLGEDDRLLARSFVQIFYTAFFEDREMLLQAEPEFRRVLLGRIDALPRSIALYSAEGAKVALRAAQALIEIPQRLWKPNRSPPGALLRADHENAVPFHGRESETTDILSWCGRDLGIGVRLYTGAGGMGKTRLFLELCKP